MVDAGSLLRSCEQVAAAVSAEVVELVGLIFENFICSLSTPLSESFLLAKHRQLVGTTARVKPQKVVEGEIIVDRLFKSTSSSIINFGNKQKFSLSCENARQTFDRNHLHLDKLGTCEALVWR